MKTAISSGLAALLLAGPTTMWAQDLSGAWQGVETTAPRPGYWPSVLTLKAGRGGTVTGTLYEEDGSDPAFVGLFELRGTQKGGKVQVNEMKILEQRVTRDGSWCQGAITFTYDAAEEKLTGEATYKPVGTCNRGSFELYRVKLKSPDKVKAGVLSTLRVSGKNVRWFADPDLKHPLAAGNEYRTKLSKTTTFYLAQGFYTTDKSPIVPITIRVTGAAAGGTPPPTPAPAAVAPPPPPPVATPTPALAETPAPVVLPTVLFKATTTELLPESYPALDQLAASLKARPTLRLRVSGHTDRIGEPDKNLLLSQRRAEAVKEYLVKAGVAAERIETVGYGDTRPVYVTPDVRNRRVEVEELK